MLFRELNHASCKTYLVLSQERHTAALIDPVRERVDRYLAMLAYLGARLEMVIDTHTHADHRSGALDLRELTGAPIVMHRRAPAPHVDTHVEDGQLLRVGEVELRVLYTPGHSTDSVSLYCEGLVMTGDLLLIHGTGRCDFAGGDAGAGYDSIMRKLFTLPEDTAVFPAHDYRGHASSTIADEKRSNPRLRGRTRAEYVELMNHLGLALPNGIQEALQPNQSDIDASIINFPTLAQLNQVRQLEPNDVKARLEGSNRPFVLDVREAEEFHGELGHIGGAERISLRELAERADQIERYKGAEVIVVCRVGMRSTTAAAILSGLGFEHVYNLKGGMLDWNEAGLPVER